jgi:hypothetical protein
MMASGEVGDRRAHRRFAGIDATATLHFIGAKPSTHAIVDISAGGISLQTGERVVEVGTDIDIELPGGARVRGKVLRRDEHRVVFRFARDERALAAVERLIRTLMAGEARPGEAHPGEARPGEARPGEARPGEAGAADARAGEDAGQRAAA